MEETKYAGGSDSPTGERRESPGMAASSAKHIGPSEFIRNWVELRLMGQQPDRRSYHSSFIFEKKLFVFGGLDIREGSLNSLYELNLQCLNELNNEEMHTPGGDPMQSNHRWRLVQTTGNASHIPSNIAYHSSCVYKDNMYLFGGNSTRVLSDGNQDDLYADKIYYLNLRTMGWSMIRARGDQVMLRDEHTGCIDLDST